MTPRTRMDAVPISISKEELMQTMFTSPHTRLPVYEDDLDHILGIIHLKDLVHHHLENSVFDLKTLLHSIPFVPERLQADRLLARLKRDKIHMAIVLDEYGGTAGLITMEDLIEEVVGDVHDEFDTGEEPDIKVIAPGHLIVAGEARLDEIKPFVDLETKEEDVDTVGGLLIAHISLPPKIGAKTIINRATLQVEALDGLTIQQVSIRYEPEIDTPLESEPE
jgi:CBS domain containing-hemolysin-like protein